MLANIITKNGITIIHDGQVITIDSDHFNYKNILAAVQNDDFDEVMRLRDEKPEDKLQYLKGKISCIGDKVYFGQYELHGVIVDRLRVLLTNNEPIEAMENFLTKLFNNPSKRSVEQLYNFLEKENLPIAEDGDFYAYKTVMKYTGSETRLDSNGKYIDYGDLIDKYSGSIRNNVGDIVSMPRNLVQDDPDVACHVGLHCGSLTYSGPGGSYNSPSDTVIVVKINPADCVSVPVDHNYDKLRVCRYEVSALYIDPLNKPVYKEDEELKTDTYYDTTAYIPISPNRLRVGDYIVFDYNERDREGTIDYVDNSIVTLKCNDGHFKSFRISQMKNVMIQNDLL